MGSASHASRRAGLLRGNWRRNHVVCRHLTWYSGVNDPHHHRCNHRRRRGEKSIGGALGGCEWYRDGLGHDDSSGGGNHSRAVLLAIRPHWLRAALDAHLFFTDLLADIDLCSANVRFRG